MRNSGLSPNLGATSASFAYDGLGRRRSKTVGGVTTAYLYDGMNPIQEQSGASIQANLLAGPGLDQWYARTQGGQTVSYLPDALGSTVALANASQAIATSYTYEPYGKTTATGAATGNTFAYTGRESDGTGLYYYRARYYHPGVARFVSEDPIGLAGGYNLMEYVGGNPIARVDPSGLVITDAEIAQQLEAFARQFLNAGEQSALNGGKTVAPYLNEFEQRAIVMEGQRLLALQEAQAAAAAKQLLMRLGAGAALMLVPGNIFQPDDPCKLGELCRPRPKPCE